LPLTPSCIVPGILYKKYSTPARRFFAAFISVVIYWIIAYRHPQNL